MQIPHKFLGCCLACFVWILPITTTSFAQKLFAEIVWVDIYWTESCTAKCATMIEQRLKAIPAVAAVEVYAAEGRARMHWRPNHRLTYMMVKSAVAWVGVDISDMLVQVRGNIQSGSSNMSLISSGDGTRFALLGFPETPDTQTKMINWENSASYPLNHAVRQQLWQARQNNQIVTVQGPLFQFWNPPLSLIIAKMQVGEEKPQNIFTGQLPPQAPYRNDPWNGQPARFRAPANPQKTNAIQPLRN